ncbi:hypothetical protein AU196_01365 [Mycobacterium sp. IS-1742]|nr:hypothetical protein AU196_01365 [Mycobacterium sp. IS-1742]
MPVGEIGPTVHVSVLPYRRRVSDETDTETIYRNPVTTEMQRRKAYLKALPGYRLNEDLEALNRCSYTFSRNAQQLTEHVGTFLKSPTMWAREVSDDYVNELVRLLHNYLTSVTSLIDAQRVVMRHRWPTERVKAAKCAACNRPLQTKQGLSEFETKDYAEQLKKTFETGEAEFMQKLRNYCTHYAIPVPGLGTTMSWQGGGPVIRLNTLQLDRDALLRWDEWRSAATAYLKKQPPRFDFAPIIERYQASARAFFQWFWDEVNARSVEELAELNAKAKEVQLWWDERNLAPYWVYEGNGRPPPGWNGRRERAKRRAARYQHGTQGFRVSTVDTGGVIELGITDWDVLPR